MNGVIIITIYKELQESLLDYGILIWDGLYNSHAHKLRIVQNTMVKTIYIIKVDSPPQHAMTTLRIFLYTKYLYM